MKNRNRFRGKLNIKLRYLTLIRILVAFMAFALILVLQQAGISYNSSKFSDNYLGASEVVNKQTAGTTKCLLLYDSQDLVSNDAIVQYRMILKDMRVAYDEVDVSKAQLPAFTSYKNVVITFTDINKIGINAINLLDWVENSGGHLLVWLPMSKSTVFQAMFNKLGIDDMGDTYATISSFKAVDGFMLGSGTTYKIDDAYEVAMTVSLTDDSRVMASTEDGRVPLIWYRTCGKGRVVVDNFGYTGKAYRGINASAYSLLDDISIYPVINASAFYLDDFPSPVPSGDATYINRDYNVSVAEFYSKYWWPDLINLADKYKIKFTGLIIENYGDDTDGEVYRNNSLGDYHFYGDMLLHMGGELGYHGYNHQPLVTDERHYDLDDLGYSVWDSEDAMYKALKELTEFSAQAFPATDLSVYVPPSNVLSPAGRQLISKKISNIKAISSTYLPGSVAYDQEFEVASDGIIEAPRVVSGAIFDDYQKITAFSELNMHYVNSHFMHPDDLLDEDRGAALGWPTLYKNIDNYCAWLQKNAPSIRQTTGSGMAGAVKNYASMGLDISETDEWLHISVSNYMGPAYVFVRINNGAIIKDIYGGKIEKLTGNLYLLELNGSEVSLIKKTD